MVDLDGVSFQTTILGSALRYGATESTVNAFSRINKDMFTINFLRDVFLSIKYHIDNGIQYSSLVIDEHLIKLLAKNGVPEYESQFNKIAEMEKTAIISDLKGAVSMLIQCYQLRTMQRKLTEVQERIIAGGEPQEAINEIESMISIIDDSEQAHNPSSVDELIDSYPDHIESKLGSMGIRTGYIDCDKLIGRVHPGNLIILGGRSGQGKTEFACNWALDAAQNQGLNVLFFSLEMGKQELMDRLIAINLKKPVEFLDDPKKWVESISGDWALVGNAGNMLRGKDLTIHDEQGLTIAKMRQIMKKVEMRTGRKLDAVFIDYIQIMKMPGKRSRYEEMCDLSVGLKSLAKEFSLPIIGLAQLNRESVKSNREPKNHDIKDCGQIEQDADKIIFVYRDLDNKENEGLAKIIFGKVRQGRTGAAVLAFQNGHFYNYSGGQQFMSQEELAANAAKNDSNKGHKTYKDGYRPS